LPSGRGPFQQASMHVLAYVAPASVVWALLSILFRPLSHLSIAGLVVVIYACIFGFAEVLGLALRTPQIPWQVPADWVRRRGSREVFIWGALLGPGLVTRNPYAAMWLVPALLSLQVRFPLVIGITAAAGAAHGGARAIGTLRLQRSAVSSRSIEVLGWQFRWRYIDGLILLLGTGAFAAPIVEAVVR
jgi:hypothetical protein